MIDISAKIVSNFNKVARATARAKHRALRSAGAYVRRVAQNSIKRGKIINGKTEPSPAGKPPFYWRRPGMNFRQSILFGVDGDSVVVGAIAGRYGQLGKVHEFGGDRRIKTRDKLRNKISVMANYPARPYMAPALAKSLRRINEFWANAVR